jgi:hypothetical protein
MPRRRGIAAALLVLAAGAGCTDVSTDPQVPLSLQFDSLPALAVVVGDTMRGASLEPTAVPVRAFDGNGAAVSDSLIRIIGIDTSSVSAFGFIGGLRLVGVRETAAVRVVAQAGSLQSQTQTFAVVAPPTGIVKSSTVNDSIVYDRLDTTQRDTDVGVNVIRQVPDSAPVTLNGLRVRFSVDSFSQNLLDSVRLEGTGSPRPARSAIVVNGAATIRVKAYSRTGATGTGAIWIAATHRVRGVEAPGSPLRLTIRLVPFTLPSGAVRPPLAPARALP